MIQNNPERPRLRYGGKRVIVKLDGCPSTPFAEWRAISLQQPYTTTDTVRKKQFSPPVDEVLMGLTRREACSIMPALVAVGIGFPELAAQDDSLPSATYPSENIPAHGLDHAQVRKIIQGKLATGEHIEAHETTLPPNGYPHPPHHHVHSEMWLIREGTVELTINGKTNRLGPGGLGFVHSNEEHGIRNVGTGPATYFVVAIGPGAGS